ncbi:MAG TPA: sugar phosphate isomerase/epimerase family protein [Chloroflexota bacterium]|nr:sugar phosphate isomerase/epimerase family protein [Chloroflexota bacterium]
MQLAYAFRRSNLFPYDGDAWNLPGKEARLAWYKLVRGMGFAGIEIANNAVGGPTATAQAVQDLGKELADNGVPCVCVRGGGGMANPRVAAASKQRMEEAVVFAQQLGCPLVNTTVGVPTLTTLPGNFTGDPTSQGSSRDAHESDFQVTAQGVREVARKAADLGIELSIEVHQHSIADNSWSALHLLDLIDQPNVGVNPDLGNILWTYDVPEETSENAIRALAPRAKYWHCKNLRRVYIPENKHTIFLRVPLPDGEIDYRFAISAMQSAGYRGYLAIEGMQLGDHLTGDRRSAAYAKEILAELEDRT